MPPRERQKLQPRSVDVLGNVSDRYYREGNVEGMERIGQEMRDRLKNNPGLQPGTGYLFPNTQEPWNNPGPGSYWNAGLQSGDNTGVMSFNDSNVNQMKDNYLGHRLFDTGWGQGILSHWANKFGGEGDSQRLEEVLSDLEDNRKRGWLGADWDFDIGRNNFGVNATWNLQDLFRRE